MGAPEVLCLLRQSGLDVTADGGRLIVQPAERLTDDLRKLIRGNRVSILSMLGTAESDTAHHHWIVQFADGRCIETYHHPDATRAEVTARYPNCVDLEPLPKPDPHSESKLHLDSRRTCAQCVNPIGHRCQAARRGEIVANLGYKPGRDNPWRREGDAPGTDDPEKRPGIERWPELIQKGCK